MDAVLKKFIIKMNYYNKLVKDKKLTDTTFKDFEKETETKTNEVDKLLEINITNPKELLELDFTQPLGIELVLYKPDNAENYDKIVTLFEVSGGDANKFIKEKFYNAQKPLLFLALDICVFNYSGSYFLTNDLKKLKHEKVTKKQTSPFFTKTAEAGAKSPEPDASESEMQKAYIKVKRLCKEITDGAFKDIAKEEVWKDPGNPPFYKTNSAYFIEFSETLDLKKEIDKHIEINKNDYIENILGTKEKDGDKYNLDHGTGTGSIFELENTIFKFFTNYNQKIEDYDLITNRNYFTEAILLGFAKADDETFKANVKKFTEKIQPLLEAVDQLIELQTKFIEKNQNDFFKKALAKFENVIIETLTEELKSPAANSNKSYKESIEEELKKAQTKIEEKKKMLEGKKVDNPKLTEAQQKLETAKAKFLDAKEEQRLAKVALEAATRTKTAAEEKRRAADAVGNVAAAAAAGEGAATAAAAIAAAAAAAADEAVKAADAELKAAEAELKAAEAALTALTAPIAVGGSIQIGGDDFATKYAEFQALKTEIDTHIAQLNNPKAKKYQDDVAALDPNAAANYIASEYNALDEYIKVLKGKIETYKEIVDKTILDNALKNADNKKIIYNYIGTLIDEFICYVNSAEKLSRLITKEPWAFFNPYIDNNTDLRHTTMVAAVDILIQTITMLLDIYNSIDPTLLNDAIKTRIKENKWIVLIHKLGKRMYKTTIADFPSESEFYKNFMEVQIYRILLVMANRNHFYKFGVVDLMDPVTDQLPQGIVIEPPIDIIVDVAYVQVWKLIKILNTIEKTTKRGAVYSYFIDSLNVIWVTVVFYYNEDRDAEEESQYPLFFGDKCEIIKGVIKTIYEDKDKDKSCEDIFNLFITNFKLKLKDILHQTPNNFESSVKLVIAVHDITFLISNYKIKNPELDELKSTLRNTLAEINKILENLTSFMDRGVDRDNFILLVKNAKTFCEAIIELKIEKQNELSKAYEADPVNLIDTSIGVTTSTTATPTPIASSDFKTPANDKIDIEATFFTLLMFYASYDFSIDGLIVEKFKSKFVEKRFEIKPFLLFDSNEFDIIKKIREKGSDFDPHVFDLTKESLQLFHVGSIGSLWDYANGKLTILLYNMLKNSSYKELLKRKYNSNKLFLFECINALKHFKAHILQPGKSSTITFAMSTLKAIEILLVKLSFILNAFEQKFIAADSVIFQVTINGKTTNYTINSPYEVTSHAISSAARRSTVLPTLALEGLNASRRAETDDTNVPPPTPRGDPSPRGGTTDLTGHDDTHAYRVATPDYLPLYHKKTENDDHARRMHTTEIKLPIISTKSSKTQSKERGTKKEPSVRRKKKASSRYTNKIKKILTRVFR